MPSTLEHIIIDRIRREGPISFRDFMELALYYPGYGYYTSPTERIGKNGDYYTSPLLTSLFGQLIARQLEEMWILMGRNNFSIVEFGSGNGQLCHDILSSIREREQFFQKITYFIIEKNNSAFESLSSTFPGKIIVQKNISALQDIHGCILSNELLDNFPVHKVVMNDELMETWVSYENGFFETLRPARPELRNYFHELDIQLPTGYRTEICLDAIGWINEAANSLKSGFVITIDYGFTSSELYRWERREGSLVCYHKHQVGFSPYDNIGEQDITTHVNFSALDHWGKRTGLQCCGFTTQYHFLTGLGLTELVRQFETTKEDPQAKKEKQLMISRFMLDMGKKFRVLIQQKGPGHPRLSGLNFSVPLV